jgi:hypothetical protein
MASPTGSHIKVRKLIRYSPRQWASQVAVPIRLSGTNHISRPSQQKRLSVRKVVGMVMKGGGLLVALALIIGVFAVIANANTIKAHILGTDRRPVAQQERNLTLVAKAHRLMHLKNSVARHSTPDAIVYIPAGFDLNGPLNLLIYNHGLTNNLDECYEFWELDKQIRNAPKNTVMILPEWATDPEAYSSACGRYNDPGFFRNMLSEILSKTPELRDKRIEDINNITIATFSGGFRPTQTQIERNGLEDKVIGIICLDSLYESNFFDNWLQKNIRDLATGKKFYQNFYFDTAANSMEQLTRVRRMLADAGLPQSAIYVDKDHPKEVVSSSVIQQHPISYIYTTMYSDQRSAHQSAAYLYFPEALKAIATNQNFKSLSSGLWSSNLSTTRYE